MPIRKILVADDSQLERQVIGDALARQGYQVSYATNVADAITQAMRLQPDLILMDIIMPHPDGFRAMRALLQDPHTRQIPVVLFSARVLDGDRDWGLRLGATAYLPKPVNMEELANVIARINS